MKILDLLITDSTEYVSEHYVHRAYISLPDYCVEPTEYQYGNQEQVKLTEAGIKHCQQFYAKKYEWCPTYYNYKLIVLNKKEIRELKKSVEMSVLQYTKELNFLKMALNEIGWAERKKKRKENEQKEIQ